VSLRLRLTLIISLLMLVGMLLGVTFQVVQARQRVSHELSAATDMAYQLLDSMLLQQPGALVTAEQQQALQVGLAGIDSGRHISIMFMTAGMMSTESTPVTEPAAPGWFVRLVKVPEVERWRPLSPDGTASVLIRSNSAAEIGEAWLDSRTFLILLLLLLLIFDGLLYFTIGRWLAPVGQIVASLQDAEQGDFTSKVQQASLPELRLIGEKLNQLNSVLRSSKAENSRLSHLSLQIQEEERRKLALELHDELGQALSAIKAIAWSLQEQVRGDETPLERGVEKIGNIAIGMSSHMRVLLGRLRPANLDELGLLPALDFMVQAWNENHASCRCLLSSDASFSMLRDPHRMHVYRILQEALTNVARHSAATQVHLVLQSVQDKMLIWISDNGQGFDEQLQPSGIGLRGIRVRGQALGGQLALQARPGAGVQIRISFLKPDYSNADLQGVVHV
jgi:two-component system, NarL family, sensor histidine kinase UhpB